MKINNLQYNLSFKGKIIDSHMHHGKWGNGDFGTEAIDKFIKSDLNININGTKSTDTIEKVIISSLNSIGTNNRLNEVDGLEETIKLFGSNNKVGVLAVCQPNLTEGNPNILKEAIQKHSDSVIGFKFHPTILKENILGQDIKIKPEWYEPYLKLAEEKKLPCLFHSDSAFSKPIEIYKLAKKHPNLPIILGHTGGADFEDALNVIKKSDVNLYCDISWLDWGKEVDGMPAKISDKLIKLISDLKETNKLDRILFGSDAPLGCYGEKLVENVSQEKAYEKTIETIQGAIKKNFPNEADDIIEKIFYKNADELFFQKNWAKKGAGIIEKGKDIIDENSDIIKKVSKSKIGMMIGAGVLAFGGLLLLLNKKTNKTTQEVSKNIQNNILNTTTLKTNVPLIFAEFGKSIKFL